MKLTDINYQFCGNSRTGFVKKMSDIQERSSWISASCSDLRYVSDIETGEEYLALGKATIAPFLAENPTMSAVIEYIDQNPGITETPISLFEKITKDKGFEEKQRFPLTEYAKSDLIDRAKLGTRFKNQGFLERNQGALNDALWVAGFENEGVKLYTIDGVVFAVPSANYKPLPIATLIDIMEEELRKEYDDVSFSNGYYSHELMGVDFAINDRKIIKAYEKAFNQFFYKPRVILRLVTSNLGFSGANLYPMLEYSTSPSAQPVKMMLGSNLTMPHKGLASIEEFRKNVQNSFSLIYTLPESLKALNDIVIDHPVHCLINLADKCGVPAKYIEDVAEQASYIFNGNEASARQLYLLFSKVVNKAKDDRESLRLSEKVGRGVNILLKHKDDVDITNIKWKSLCNIIVDEGQLNIETADTIPEMEQLSFMEVSDAS